MQTRYQRNSRMHFAWPLLLSWITQLIQNWRAWISQGGMFHPAMEEKTLALTWHCNVGHACFSTAAEQMWALPNGSVDGPERYNKQFVLLPPLYIPFFFIFLPLQIQWGIKQMPWLSKNVLVLFSVGAYSLQSLQSLDTCSVHEVQTLALWNMPYFDFCPYLCMFLMYTQLLMNWRGKMLCPVLGWLYIRLNFKTLNTWSTLVSIHMWMCVCAGPSWDFIEIFECGWLCIREEPECWLCRALESLGRWSHKRWFPLVVGIEETAVLVRWLCRHERCMVEGPLLCICFSDLMACGTLRTDDLWTRHHLDVLEENVFRWKQNSSLVLCGNLEKCSYCKKPSW